MMGLKQFNKDVALAKDASINRVSSIRRGDSDGELVFTYSHANLSSPLTIQVLILDTDSYPQSSSFMIFTASDCVEEGVTPFLEQLSGSMRRKNVEAVIETISERLTIKLETNPATKEESDLDGALAPEDNETSVEDDEEDEEDEYLFFETNVPKLPDEDPAFYLTASSVKRLRKDLRAAHSAGISVGVLPEGQSVRQAEMFSLSIRIGKLGIPEDALKAWDQTCVL